jgi:hypothetical protein
MIEKERDKVSPCDHWSVDKISSYLQLLIDSAVLKKKSLFSIANHQSSIPVRRVIHE